jgi:DNA-binding transcriptional LysR family regulator
MLNKIHDAGAGAGRGLEIDPGIVDSKRLQMFYVAAKEGSFAAAASQLGVSPSAISHALKGLEEDLGCALFRRSGPQVKATGAGVRLLPMVEDLLARMASIKSELAALDGRTESLVFRLPAALLGLLHPDVLSSFRECFPAATVEILVTGDGREPACGRGVDFEIGYAEEVPDDAVRRDLVREELGIYMAPFHALGRSSRIGAGDLRKHLMILPDRGAHDLVMRQVFRGVEAETRSWILPSAGSARELGVQGQGLVFLPEWAVGGAMRNGSLARLKLTGFELRRTCCAWWQAHHPLTWIAEVFLSLLAGEIERRLEEFGGGGAAVSSDGEQ